MKILFLDDDNYRYKQILHARGYRDQIDWVETAETCIAALAKHEQYDQIWLDHDLGGKIYVDTAHKNTGSEVVRHILKNELPIKSMIVIHSMNTSAALSMEQSLKKAGYDVCYIPFNKAKEYWNAQSK